MRHRGERKLRGGVEMLGRLEGFWNNFIGDSEKL